MRSALFVLVLAVSFAGCGDDDRSDEVGSAGGAVVFGADDTVCPSTVLTNDLDDDARARAGGDCFLDAVETGTPVVWDVSVPTVEGDPLYHRFDATGEDVLIVVDTRADTFGTGSVVAQRCASVGRSADDRLPVGADCVDIDHPGFADANG